MNSLIESLNVWGARFFDFALPILWQSSLLIAVVFAVDFSLRRNIRPAVRYTLWFVVFIKLLIPPTLALPTSAAWWLRMRPVQIVAAHMRTMSVNYSEPVAAFVPPEALVVPLAPPPARLSSEAWILIVAIFVSALLAGWPVFRWRQMGRCVRKTTAATGEIQEMLAEVHRLAGLRKKIRLQLTAESMSPAVCGLFRPVVLLPQSLIERLTPNQLRAVLFHELIHLRRCDVWVNCAQTLLQIVYWWHPLLWFANARMRRVREEAVDDAVMFALNEEAEIYAPTLLEVAKLALNRPLATLGLVGILESRNALRHRIERLLNFTRPRRVGVSVMSLIGIAAFTALAVPMGEPPARSSGADEISEASNLITFHAKVNPEIFMRNIKARAGETMHTTNDDWNDILVSILDGFGVDCTPPRDITFNPETGELRMKNSSEALTIVDEVVKELSLPGGERVLNPPHGLKQVLIEAQFYQMRPDDFARLNLDSGASHRDHDLSPWWKLSPEQLTDVRQRIKELGIRSMSSPRIQTAHGIEADLFIGDGTNNIQLECVPYVSDDLIKLTALARTTGKYALKGKGWPDLAGHTNCAIFSRVAVPNGGGVVLRAEHAGTMPENELIVLLNGKILEPVAPGISPVTRGRSNVVAANTSAASTTDDRVKMLLKDGKLMHELGKLDEAEAKFKEVLEIQPDNRAAQYYLSIENRQQIRDTINAHNGGDPRVVPNPYARTNIIYANVERQKLYDELNTIIFDKIGFDNLPLSDVVRNLTELTQRRDIDQQGINFVLNRAKPATAATPLDGTNGQPQTFDPVTGQPIIKPPTTDTDDVDLGAVTISLDPGLKNVRLLDVLEAIVKSSDHPIKYSILNYGIEFSFKGPDVPVLHTRTFKVDVNTFLLGLQNVGVMSIPHVNASGTTGGGGTNRGMRYVTGVDKTSEIQLALINFFDEIGVKLAAPKSVFFSDRQGTLTVHATAEDLDLIEQAINTLNLAPPEVTIKVRFVEVDAEFLTTLFMNGAGVSTNTPWTGILTEPLFKPILKSLERMDHATLLNEGEVTTLSGRQANFQVVDVKTIVSGFKTTVTTNATDYGYETTNVPFGRTLDVVAAVSADGYTISMSVTPTATEFLGYDDPKIYEKYDEKLKHAKLPLVRYRVRKMTASAVVWDGQTLVLGNLSDESVVAEPNGAKLLQQPFKDKKRKQLIIFITPVITDPKGNRVHSNEEAKLLAK